MISGYCEEKYIPLKKIFENYFLEQEEIGASFAIYKEGKPLIDLWNGLKNKNNKNWEENTIVNVFSATKGIYEIITSILIDQNILENQDPDHSCGQQTYYHAKTHGFLIGEIIKKTTKKSIGELVSELLSKKLKVEFFIGTPKDQLSNIASLYEDKTERKIVSEFNAFNNPEHEINFYNKQNWQVAEVPSMNGHGNARSIAKIYDVFVNDLILDKNILLSKSSINKCLTECNSRIDKSLMMPIRWSKIGLILRGGWLFGKNKESFGHNGWGGSLGFGDPVLGIGVAYTTNKINPTMGSDFRIIKLLKEFYKIH